ncbi:MAG: hypothetical protein RLZZ66_1309 [Pseudomonadota bacterium]|jgi:hypothetical protein
MKEKIDIKNKYLTLFLLCCGTLLHAHAYAADAAPKPTYKRAPVGTFQSVMDDTLLGNNYEKPIWNLHDALNLPDWLALGVDHRTRYEGMDGSFRSTNRGDQQINFQTSAWLQATINNFRFATEFMDSRAMDSDVNNQLSTDTADFVQAYVSWADKDAFNTKLGMEFKVGRQTLDLGSRRFIARPYYRNTVNSFTGLKFRILDNSNWQFQTFTMFPVSRVPAVLTAQNNDKHRFDEEDFNTWFSGGIFEFNRLPMGITGEAYLYYFDEAAETTDNVRTRNRQYYTPGVRFYIKPKKGQFDFQAEGMGQFGTARYNAALSTNQNHEAWSSHVELGYTFEVPWSPRVFAEYDYASGNKNPSKNNSEDTRFDWLFGSPVPDFGHTGLYGAFTRSNINSPGYKINFTPRSDTVINFQHRFVWLASSSDCWGGAACIPPTTMLKPSKNSGSYVGDQIGINLRHDFNSSLTFDSGWYHLFKGEFAKNGVSTAGKVSPEDIDFFYIQSQFRF